jgi:hypothetical protein
MERIHHRVVIGSVAPDHPEFRADTLLQGKRCKQAANGEGFLRLERPLPIAQIRKFKPELIAEVDRLLDRHCDREIADILNQRGCRTWEAKPFNLKKIAFIRTAYKLPSRYERLRRLGMLTTREVAARFGVSKTTVQQWGRQGLITQLYPGSEVSSLSQFARRRLSVRPLA